MITARLTNPTGLLLAALALAPIAHGQLANGSFEAGTVFPAPINYIQTPQANVIGWQTTAAFAPINNDNIELWSTGFLGVPAAQGTYFAEINSESAAALFQEVSILAAGEIDYFFSHRGRAGSDTMTLAIINITAPGSTWSFNPGTETFSVGGGAFMAHTLTVTTNNDAWVQYTGDNVITTSGGETFIFAYASGNTASNDKTIGNFLDDVGFDVDALPPSPIPEPSSFGMLGALLLVGFAGVRRRSLRA